MPLSICRPKTSEVAMLWAELEKEKHRFFRPPESLNDLVSKWGVDLLLFVGKVDEQLAALFAVYDPTFDGYGRPISGVVLLYILPEFRSGNGIRLGRLALDKARQYGFKQFWTWCRADNRPACVFAGLCGFYRCGSIPGYAEPGTLAVDAVYYTWRTTDAERH